MLLLKELHVKNFRSLYDERFDLPALTVLVGKNDAGKSNILEAIQLLFEGTASDVKAEDFYDVNQPIEITATLRGAREYLALCDDRNRPRVTQRVSAENELVIRRITDERKKLKGIEIRNQTSGDFESPTGIDAALKPLLPEVIFIEALADVAEQTKGTQKDALGKLIAQVLSRIEEAVEPRLQAAYGEANRILNVRFAPDGRTEVDDRIQDLIDIEHEITNNVQETFPDSAVRLKVILPSVKTILGSVDVYIKEGQHEDPYQRRGQGFQRTLYLSLLRALANRIRAGAEQGVARPFLLLFEEPEAFLHPDGQTKMRAALQTIAEQAQVIMATHSPIMVTPALLSNTVRIQKHSDVNHPKPITKKTGPVNEGDLTLPQRQLLPLFSIQRSSRFLFSRGVVLVEGIGDEHIFPAMVERLRNFRLDNHDIAIIETGGKDNLIPFAQILSNLGLPTWILTDLDFLWTGAGGFFGTDREFAQFMQRLSQLAPAPTETTEAARREHKRQQVRSCTVDLAAERNRLCDRLAEGRIFVLREGEIEEYAGLGQHAKSQYLKAAEEIISGRREINHRQEIENIANALDTWSAAL